MKIGPVDQITCIIAIFYTAVKVIVTKERIMYAFILLFTIITIANYMPSVL